MKKTLYFSKPSHLSITDGALKIENKQGEVFLFCVEDLGYIILESPYVSLTQPVLARLMEANVVVVTCDEKYMPNGMMISFSGGHHQTSARQQAQVASKLPLRKQLWQQTVSAKIKNQGLILQNIHQPHEAMQRWSREVRSGDPDNIEARAAIHYWKYFSENRFPDFRREPKGAPPNAMLNYGYALLRSMVARSLTSSGLLLSLGIFHHNQYNAFCLVDDVMEPFRPFVDQMVLDWYDQNPEITFELEKKQRIYMLDIFTRDSLIHGEKSPLMEASRRTAASLAQCFMGLEEKILFPVIPC